MQRPDSDSPSVHPLSRAHVCACMYVCVFYSLKFYCSSFLPQSMPVMVLFPQGIKN